jgi:hypothetical protein
VVAWGVNTYGQTTVPSGLTQIIAVAGGRDHSLALRSSGTVVAWGDSSYGQTNVPGTLANVIGISAGGFHNAAVQNDGSITCWGYNFYNQASVPADVTNATAVSCGNAFTMALRNDGTVRAWGDNIYGQTNVPAGLSNVTAIAAGGFHGLALKADGTVTGWGYNFYGQATPPSDLSNVTAIAAGYFHSLALTDDGTVVQWGDISAGQSSPIQTNRIVSLTAGYAHSIALRDDKPFFLIQPQDITTNSGKSVKLFFTGLGTTPVTNRWWRFNGVTTTLVTSGSVSNVNGILTNSLTFTTTSNQFYFAVMSNAVGSVTSRLATVTIMTNPTVTSQPVSVTTNPGANITFTVGMAGSGPFTYQWQFKSISDTNFNDYGSPTSNNFLQLNNVTTNDAGDYRVVIANQVGSVTSQVATLTLDGRVLITAQPQGQTVAQGSNVTLSVSAVGSPPLRYQWFFNDTLVLPDATNETFSIASVQTSDAGSYSVVVSNDMNAVTSSAAGLTVLGPPVIITQPQDIVTNSGKSVKLTLSASGSLPMSNRWWRIVGAGNVLANSGTVSNNNGLVTNTFTFSTTSNQFYFAVLSNSVGAVTSRVASVTILTNPVVTSQPQSVTTNYGATVAFSASATGSPPLTYQWQHSEVDIPGAISNAFQIDSVSSNDGGGYRVIVANPVGVVTSLVATLTLDGTPIISTNPQNRTILQGGTATFAVVAQGADPLLYQWWQAATNGQLDFTNGVITVTNAVTDATNSSLTIVNADSASAGTYFVVVSNNVGTAASLGAKLTVLIPPTINSGPQDIVTNSGKLVKLTVIASGSLPMTNRWWRSNGTSNTLVNTSVFSTPTNGSTGYSNAFTFTTTTNQFYYSVVANSAGSVTSRLASITIQSPPTITNQPQGVVTNEGATVFFYVGATGDAPLLYQWQFNSADIGSATNNYLQLNNVTTNDAGDYRVVISNPVGTATSDVARLVIANQSYTPAQLWLLAHSSTNGDAIFIALEAGKNYRVQTSADLGTWNDLTNFLSSATVMEFTNGFATNAPQMFYRVVSP